jgi:phage shock protein A
MSIFNRVFKIGQAEVHSVIDKFEDPIKLTEQGIRDLKRDLEGALTSLAEVKAIAIRTRREADNKKKLSADYERKAMLLLQKGQQGELNPQEADRLAMESLSKKEQQSNEALRTSQEAERHEKMADQLQGNVNKIKSAISTYENELTTLKARATTAASTKKINKQLAKIDASGTIAMLEKMKAKVEEDEALAVAYGEIATPDRTVDEEITNALEKGQTPTASANLLELKKKMGIV